jgi:tetratricopeptide (TPR) repeat protein
MQKIVCAQLSTILCVVLALPIQAQPPSNWESKMAAANQAESTGKMNEAETNYRTAIGLAEKFPQPDIRLAISLANLGMLLSMKTRFTEAEGSYKRAISILQKITIPEAADTKKLLTARSLCALGAVYAEQGKYPVAEETLKQSITVSKTVISGEGPAETASAMSNLAFVYEKQKKHTESIALIHVALNKLGTAKLQKNEASMIRGKLLGNLACALIGIGQAGEAEKYANEAMSLAQTQGTFDPSLAEACEAIGAANYAQGDLARSGEWNTRALNLYSSIFGPQHPRVAGCLHNMAMTMMAKQDYNAAEPLLRKSIAIMEPKLPSSHPNLIEARKHLASLLRKTGREDAAALEESKIVVAPASK